jgi:transposase
VERAKPDMLVAAPLQYVTVVIDHARGAVVWARQGKDAATLGAFFDELGKERCAKLEAVTLDLSAAYIKAVTQASPQARLIFDRFHVQRLAHDALDTVRREQWRAADPEEKRAIKGTRFALQKNPCAGSQPHGASPGAVSQDHGASPFAG